MAFIDKKSSKSKIVWYLLFDFIRKTPKCAFIFTVIIVSILWVKLSDIHIKNLQETVSNTIQQRQRNIFKLFFLEVFFSVLQESKYLLFLLVYGDHIQRISLIVFKKLLSEQSLAEKDFENGTLQNNFHVGCIGLTELLAVLVLNVFPGIIGVYSVIKNLMADFDYSFCMFVMIAFICFLVLNIVIIMVEANFQHRTNVFSNLNKKYLYETILNYENIVTSGTDRYEIMRYDKRISNYQQQISWYKSVTHLLIILNRFIFSLVKMLVFYKLSLKNNVETKKWIAIKILLMSFERESMNMSSMYTNIMKHLTDGMNITKYLAKGTRVRKQNIVYSHMTKKIDILNLSIKDNNQGYIISNFNFVIYNGQKIALIGRNGSGKSSLLKAIAGLKSFEGQMVFYSENSNSDITLSSRQICGYVSQNIALFNESILYNILYGTKNKGLRDTIIISKKINIYKAFNAKKNGFLETVGENGQFLSGGERQKILLARILLQSPEIYILDEPYSFLDRASQKAIHNLFFNEINNITLIMTVHSTEHLIGFDTFLYVSEGTVNVLKSYEEALSIFESSL